MAGANSAESGGKAPARPSHAASADELPRPATSIGDLDELRFAEAGAHLGSAGSYRSVLRYTASACTLKSDKVLKIGGI